MRDPFPWPPEGSPEHLVRQHLDAPARTDEAASADALLRRVYARLDAEASRPGLPLPRRSRWRAALAAGLVAAGLVIGLMFVAQPVAQANPAKLVADALQASLAETDRCYLLQVEPLDRQGRAAGLPLRASHLWTRGDRYRIDQLGPDAGSLGQDELRRIWVAPTRDEGARLDHDEVSEKLALVSDLRTLRLDLLLRELMRGFHLDWETDLSAGGANTQRIRATPRRDRFVFGIRSVLLEVEPKSKIVRRLEVERVRLLSQSRVRLTLRWIDSKTQPDRFYHLESALRVGGRIYELGEAGPDPLTRARRLRVLAETVRRFGPPQ